MRTLVSVLLVLICLYLLAVLSPTVSVYGKEALCHTLEQIAGTSGEDDSIDASDIYENFTGMEKSYTGALPWEKDKRFAAARKKLGDPPVMVAYKATLHEPLPGEGHNVSWAAAELAGTVVQPGQVFSQNSTLGPYTLKRGYRPGPTYKGTNVTTTIGGGVCKVASVLYNLATFCDLPIVQRYPHSMTVPYVPPGQDATVFYGVKDFRFRNTTSEPILIWAQMVGADLYIAFYANAKPPAVTWHHQVLKRIKFWTVYKQNSALPPGEKRVAIPGQDGLVVRSWVTIEMPTGETIARKRGVSYYNASPQVIERPK